jgi:hypothetical protein
MNDMASIRKMRGLADVWRGFLTRVGARSGGGAGLAAESAVGVDFLRGGNKVV